MSTESIRSVVTLSMSMFSCCSARCYVWTQVRVTLRKPGSKLEHLGVTAELIGDIG